MCRRITLPTARKPGKGITNTKSRQRPTSELLTAANGAMEKISGVGDVAQMFAAGGDGGFASRVLMLYVAKGNAFLTIGLGGFVDDAVALEKAKIVAQKLLEHL